MRCRTADITQRPSRGAGGGDHAAPAPVGRCKVGNLSQGPARLSFCPGAPLLLLPLPVVSNCRQRITNMPTWRRPPSGAPDANRNGASACVCGEERGEGVHQALSRTRGEEVAGGGLKCGGAEGHANRRAAVLRKRSLVRGVGAGRRRAGVSRRAPHTLAGLLLLRGRGRRRVRAHAARAGARGAPPQRLALHFFSGSALPVVGRPTYTLNCGRGASGICKGLVS